MILKNGSRDLSILNIEGSVLVKTLNYSTSEASNWIVKNPLIFGELIILG